MLKRPKNSLPDQITKTATTASRSFTERPLPPQTHLQTSEVLSTSAEIEVEELITSLTDQLENTKPHEYHPDLDWDKLLGELPDSFCDDIEPPSKILLPDVVEELKAKPCAEDLKVSLKGSFNVDDFFNTDPPVEAS